MSAPQAMLSNVGSVAQPDEVVLVIDFGAQYAQLIARRVRELRVYSEIVSHQVTVEEILAKQPKALILSGGPKSVNEEGAPSLDPAILELGIPMLGICYGAQLLAQQLPGGVVSRDESGEYGRSEMSRIADSASTLLPADLPNEQTVWMSHFDAITHAPNGFVATASSAGSPVAVFENSKTKVFGVQYHPEVGHTPHGQALLKQFLLHEAGCRGNWTMGSIIEASVAAIVDQVGDGKAICALSGGVDSAVAAAMVHRAIGDRLTCIYVDTGLMRLNESDQIVETFERNHGIKLIHVTAGERYFEKLAGVTEPETKRKIIGEQFIRIFEEFARSLDGEEYLVQGTLYPDVIESGTSDAAKIKSHHNVGGLPDDLSFDLVEPLRNLFKDEVRKVGSELGLPDEIVLRQPFPGPGLGVRIIGEVTREKVEVLQQADAIVRQEIAAAGLEQELWQAFAVLPDIRTVGVMGDERTYAHPIIVRAVTSEDAMTADWARLPYELLERLSNRIINEVDGVNRVAYDITSKPPGTIEWE